MAAQGPIDRELVELVGECIARLEDEGPAVVDEIAARVPHLADALRERLRRLQSAGMLSTRAPERDEERLGDFRLLRLLASGGMGVVYEAEQMALGRSVALKVIRPELVHVPAVRERFRREVEAAARLAHHGIAQVFAVGEEGGRPYFAMEFVRGASLAEVLHALEERGPRGVSGVDLHAVLLERAGAAADAAAPPPWLGGTWIEACVGVVCAACEAIDFAHRAGVLHRDLKPSNVMATPAGRVVIVDFGLAALEGVDRLTRSGTQLGSLPYMASEQLRGDPSAIGPATDVYALGVTLHELLAFRAPYAADTAPALTMQILEGRLPRLRAANPDVPRDVEIVCAKACDVDPARRYASAGAFALDLRRALEGRPIVARPTGPVGRAARWARRRPSTALALGLAAVLVAVGAWAGHRVRQSDRRVAAVTERSLDQLALALEPVELAAGRIDVAHVDELVGSLRAIERAWGARDAGDGPTPQERATLDATLAALFDRVARRADAEEVCARIVETLAPLASAEDPAATWTIELGTALTRLGGVRLDRARLQEALDAFDRAKQAFTPPRRAAQLEDRFAQGLAAAELNRAQLLRVAGYVEEARADFVAAIATLERLVAARPGDATRQDHLAMALAGRAQLEFRAGERELALSLWPRAIAAVERAVELEPLDRDFAEDLGTIAGQHGRALIGAGELERAEASLERARTVLERLAAEFPAVPDYRQQLVQVLDSRGLLARSRGRLDDAVREHVRAVELGEELVREHPDAANYLEDLPVTLLNCAQVESDARRCDDARLRLERLAQVIDLLVAPEREPPLDADRAAVFDAGAAVSWIVCEDDVRAATMLERAADRSPSDALVWRDVAAAWVELGARDGAARGSDGRPWHELATIALRAALERGWRDASELESGAAWSALRSTSGFSALLEAARR